MGAVLCRDKAGVLAIYKDIHGCPVFAIFEGNKPLTCSKSDHPANRYKELEDFLTVMEQGGTTQIFDLRCYEAYNKNNKVNNSDPYFASLGFKVADTEAQIAAITAKAGGPANAANNPTLMMQYIDAKMDIIKLQHQYALEKKEDEIRELERKLNADDDDDDEEDLGMIGSIVKLGDKHEWIQEPIKGLIEGLTNVFKGIGLKATSITERPVQMAGINMDKPGQDKPLQEQLAWSQKALINAYRNKHGVKLDQSGKALPGFEDAMNKADTEYVFDMVKLAEVANNKPKTFNNAIEALREM